MSRLMTVTKEPPSSISLLPSPDLKEKPHCIIVGSTVTALCDANPAGLVKKCNIGMGTMLATITNYTTILGTLTTTNIIMASWSKEKWQGVRNRAVRC
ncbi:hypothetical protein KIN20_011350 [Parelaphostrongylus tenuis]|uniref:Uncharacterized protein n=1 Tax=Parelaphostrongylus tenuis TaxID=148309 RepID=A0AAD5M999_PARTN|nr:hypothetical protein KIN20_011350 [Parelaphostrongylus tenuis]